MPKAITRSSVPVGITSIETKSLDAQVSEASIDGGTTINTGAALNTFQTGLSLDVVPQLMANGIVDLNISVSVASETPKADGDENRNPTINSRTLTTSTSVPSQMTLLIGGLSIVTKTESVNGIPVLSKIPVIGETVFANKSKGEQKRTLLVFVTPTVIYPNEVPKTYVNYDEWDTIRNGETHNPQIERAPMPRAPEIRRAIPVGNGMR
jgi:type II secretory pathway component GspD/PulD (secretin)